MAKWQFKKGKLRGAFGETDYENKVIKIDKSKHRKGAKVKHLTKNKDGSENMLTTMAHELMHKAHPKMTEKQVEKLARKRVATMGKKAKAKIYAKFQ